VDKVTTTVSNVSTNLDIIEKEWEETTVTVNERYLEINKVFKEIKIEVTQEVTEISEETCRADFHAKASPCCPDCKKAKYRVPPKAECKKAGCEHSCVYQNVTCDSANKTLTEPCAYSIDFHGLKSKKGEKADKLENTCSTSSAYGEVTRPWCYLEGEKKRVGFCDCTEIRCICPKGKRLDADRKKCVTVTDS